MVPDVSVLHWIKIPSSPPNVAVSLVANVVADAPPLVVDQLAEDVSQTPLTGLAADPAGPPQNLLAARPELVMPRTSSTMATRLRSDDISKYGAEDPCRFEGDGTSRNDSFISGRLGW